MIFSPPPIIMNQKNPPVVKFVPMEHPHYKLGVHQRETSILFVDFPASHIP